MFTTNAILLKKIPLLNGDSIYELFTKDFWKVRAWVNKKRHITEADHGSTIHCSIYTKQNKNIVESAVVKHAIKTDNLDYVSLLSILLCVQTMTTICPSWVVNATLFEDYTASLPFFEMKDMNEKTKELFLLKLFKMSGMGWKRTMETESIIFRKIYTNIEKYPLKAFIKLEEINQEIIGEMRQINQICMSPYI